MCRIRGNPQEKVKHTGTNNSKKASPLLGLKGQMRKKLSQPGRPVTEVDQRTCGFQHRKGKITEYKQGDHSFLPVAPTGPNQTRSKKDRCTEVSLLGVEQDGE